MREVLNFKEYLLSLHNDFWGSNPALIPSFTKYIPELIIYSKYCSRLEKQQ